MTFSPHFAHEKLAQRISVKTWLRLPHENTGREIAQFDYLPVPNVPEVRDYSIPPDAGSVDRRSSKNATLCLPTGGRSS